MILGVLIILPSLRMAQISIEENLENVQTKNFVETKFNTQNRQAVSYKLNPQEEILEIISIGQVISDTDVENLQKELSEYSYLQNYRLQVVQNEFHEGMDEQAVNELLQNTLKHERYVGIREAESAELKKYKSLSQTYYPAYQKSLEYKKSLEKLNEKLPAAFPKVSRAEGGEILTQDKRFMIIIYVKEPVTADEAGRIKKLLESEFEMPITLNIQRDSDGANDLISGNGIIW